MNVMTGYVEDEFQKMKLLLMLSICIVMVNTVFCACGIPYVFRDIYTFGPECRYRCNCLSNEKCDATTGECPNGCLPGWMGPACQYRDMVAAANPGNSEQYPPEPKFPPGVATDGDITTCSRTGSAGVGQRYLRIDLGSMVYIVGLVIRIPPSDVKIFRGFTVEVGNTTSEFRLCFADDLNGVINEVTEVNCFEPQVGQHIRIQLSEETGTLSVCEINVYGGRIVSFNQQTQMDSVYTNSYGTFYGAYAVDGKVHTNDTNINAPETRTCSSTDVDYTTPMNRWWSVDVLHFFSIQAVSFFARQDNNNLLSQYVGYYVSVGADNTTFVEIAKDSPTNTQNDYAPKSHNLTWPKDGRFLRVKRDLVVLLFVCELEVFAECAYGRCGWDCSETCMCRSQTAGTHKILGTCPNGCTGRWTGINGKCNIECPDVKWGSTCDQDCGKCSVPCNVVNGTCPGSCFPGWEHPLCTKVCNIGTFGDQCTESCGHCLHSETCHPENGMCQNGCAAGYVGQQCKTICDMGMFGDQCSVRCGRCVKGDSCHHENGTCFNGCEAGYIGHDCKATCGTGSFGDLCTERCGHCSNGETCHYKSGLCLSGCAAGYIGHDCKTKSSCPPTTGLIVGIVVCAAFVAVETVIIAILLYKLRKSTPQLNAFYTTPSVATTRSDNDAYAEIIPSFDDKMNGAEYINSTL